MADRKKHSNRSQTAALKTSTRKQARVEKSVKAPAREDQERREPLPVKGTKASAREERRQSRQETKAAPRRESKWTLRWRNNAIGRFIYDAYYELRHKVTWPTLKEARNMAITVLVLSAVVGGVIALADYGLHELFIFIVTKSWQK